MEIQPRIEEIKPKKLVGLSMEMSVVNNKTGELWRTFGPRIKEITSRASKDRISLQVYPEDYFINFSPTKSFTKWALVEIHEESDIEGLSNFELAGGKYAVSQSQGMPGDPTIFQYIYSSWLPSSGYQLDSRPHFEVLGEKYIPGSPESQEEIWIPIK